MVYEENRAISCVLYTGKLVTIERSPWVTTLLAYNMYIVVGISRSIRLTGQITSLEMRARPQIGGVGKSQ